MPKCQECTYKEENRKTINVRHKKGMMKPGKKYCTNGIFKELTSKSLGGYDYPIWCPYNQCKNTCVECGTQIRQEEGEYCAKHRKK